MSISRKKHRLPADLSMLIGKRIRPIGHSNTPPERIVAIVTDAAYEPPAPIIVSAVWHRRWKSWTYTAKPAAVIASGLGHYLRITPR